MGKGKYTEEYIGQILKEVQETGNASVVARKYNISPSMVARWGRERKGSAVKTFKEETLKKHKVQIKAPTEYETALTENKQLKSIVGEKELEIQILRELLKKTNFQLPPR